MVRYVSHLNEMSQWSDVLLIRMKCLNGLTYQKSYVLVDNDLMSLPTKEAHAHECSKISVH